LPQLRGEAKALHERIAAIQKRIDAGELTTLAITEPQREYDHLMRQIHRLTSEVAGTLVVTCQDENLAVAYQDLRQRKMPTSRRLHEAREEFNVARERLERHQKAMETAKSRNERIDRFYTDNLREAESDFEAAQTALMEAEQERAELEAAIADTRRKMLEA
jgi:predicted  nucleic acid-binding Zn-ribbon protein